MICKELQKRDRITCKLPLEVESLDDTGILRISLPYGSPQEQVAIVNAVAKSFVQTANEKTRKRYEDFFAHASKRCAFNRMEMRKFDSRLTKLNGVIPKDNDQAKWNAIIRKDCTRVIASLKEKLKLYEAAIRQRKEYIRNPPFIVLELAEKPQESK